MTDSYSGYDDQSGGDPQADAGTGDYSGAADHSGPDEPTIDLSKYPSLMTLVQAGSNDAWLQWLGIDASQGGDDLVASAQDGSDTQGGDGSDAQGDGSQDSYS